jgi:16S rRNA (guanine527-N7)-methyltransferase
VERRPVGAAGGSGGATPTVTGEGARFTWDAAASERLAAVAARHGLDPRAQEALRVVLELLAREPSAVTTVREPSAAVDVHVADSLVALELSEVRRAGAVADLGSGGGFPGLALAVALPEARVALVESAGRKCEVLRHAVGEAGLQNVEVIHARAEAWPAGIGAHDLVVARALAPLPVVLEYAAPLLRPDGVAIAWKGRPAQGEEADGIAAAAVLGLTMPVAHYVQPFKGARDRRLYLSSKVSSTPPNYPRRPGIARKRPLRASSRT